MRKGGCVGRRVEEKAKEGIQGATTNTKGHLRNHREVFYCRNALKYINTKKEPKVIYQITEETMPP